MALNIPAILIGLEQLYDSESLRLLRLYTQDPLTGENIERVLPLLRAIDNSNLHDIKVYMLDPLDRENAERFLPLLRLMNESNSNDIKVYMLDPLDRENAERVLPILRSINESNLNDIKVYMLDPLDRENSERIFPLLQLVELNGYSEDLINQIKVTILDSNDILSIFKILSNCGVDDPFVKNLSKSLASYPTLNWNDALSKGQLFSKLWLIEELKNLDLDLGTVFVCAGWVGTLPALIFKDGNLKYNVFRSFDIDQTCADAADSLNRDPYVIEGWKFKATTSDIFEINYSTHTYFTQRRDGSSTDLTETPDTIINTSCDHIDPFDDWWNMIPKNKLVILQNNDSKIDDDHVNNINSLDEMKAQAPMEKILFEGVLRLPDYNRFMLIGYK